MLRTKEARANISHKHRQAFFHPRDAS